ASSTTPARSCRSPHGTTSRAASTRGSSRGSSSSTGSTSTRPSRPRWTWRTGCPARRTRRSTAPRADERGDARRAQVPHPGRGRVPPSSTVPIHPLVAELLPTVTDWGTWGAACRVLGAGYRAPDVDVEDLAVDGPHGPVAVRLYRP